MGSGITFLQSVNGNNPVIVIPQATNGVATNVLLSGFRLIGSVNNTSEDAMLWDASGFCQLRSLVLGGTGHLHHRLRRQRHPPRGYEREFQRYQPMGRIQSGDCVPV